MEIDGKRIAAVRTLEALGYTYCKGEWLAPAAVADTLPRITAEEAELKAIVDLIEACEAKWGPLGKEPGSKS
jgi:hypothetical protein